MSDISILLHPNIPKPMHGTNPRSIKGDQWWNEKRLTAYAENDHSCHACGVHKTKAEFHKWLEAHEFYDIDYKKGVMKLKKIVALCHSCHFYIHSGLLKINLRNNNINQEKYDFIINRGDALTVGLKRQPSPPIFAEWSDWHILIDGKKYYGKFTDYNHWLTYYNKGE